MNSYRIDVTMGIGDEEAIVVGTITRPSDLPGLLRTMADEFDRISFEHAIEGTYSNE